MITDIDARLQRAHAAVPDPDEATRARALARLEAAMAAPELDADPRRRRRSRLLIALPVAALAGAAAVAVVALLPTRVQTPIAPPIAEAAKVVCARPGQAGRCLRALSTVASGQTVLAAGKVFYQRNLFTVSISYIGADGRPTANPGDSAYAVTRTVSEDLWLASDGSGQLQYGADGPPRPASTADERAWRAAGAPDLGELPPAGDWGPKHQSFGPGELDAMLIFNSNLEAALPKDDPLSVLPEDPNKLASFLRAAAEKQRKGSSASDISNTFGTDVTTFLRYPRTPPKLRAALLQVFATLPETKSLGVIKDGAGRTAAALQLPPDMNDGNNIIAFDPETSRLLAEGVAHEDGVRWNHVYAITTDAVSKSGERP